MGRITGCIESLLASLNLTLPADRDSPGVFVTAVATTDEGSAAGLSRKAVTLSERVAHRLADRGCAATARRSSGRGRVGVPTSVVVVDRSLDLVGAASSHGGGGKSGCGGECGCVLDRLLATLPRRRPHGNQLCIPLGAASGPNLQLAPDWLPGSNLPLGGSLFHPADRVGADLLRACVLGSEREALLTLQRALVNAICAEQLSASEAVATLINSAVSAAQIRGLCRALCSDRMRAYRHAPLVELAAAILCAHDLGEKEAEGSESADGTTGSNPALREELERIILATAGTYSPPVQLLDSTIRGHAPCCRGCSTGKRPVADADGGA